MPEIEVRAAGPHDRAAVDAIHDREWGSPYVVVHYTRYDLRALPTLVAVDAKPAPEATANRDAGSRGPVVGALVWRVDGAGMEVVSIAASVPGRGVGAALLAAAVAAARRQQVSRLWLVTTNDNLPALRFYQRHGLRIVGVDPGAVDRARALKPAIPVVGFDGIPLRDELILELYLEPAPALSTASLAHES